MKRILASLLVFSLLFVPLPSQALEPKVLDRVVKSTVRLEIKDGRTICTGFVVVPERVMTAAHCIDDEYPLTVDTLPSVVIKIDRQADLALLEVKGLKRPSLRFQQKAPAIGDKVAAIGFPYGGSALIVLPRYVAGQDFLLTECSFYTGECHDYFWSMVVSGTYSPGMSGGPNVNDKGEVVSITQAGIGTLGLGQNAAVMKDFLRS